MKVGDEITVKVIGIDELGRINLSRRAVFEKLSRVPGAKVEDSPSTDYPFKKSEARPPQRPYHPRNQRPPHDREHQSFSKRG